VGAGRERRKQWQKHMLKSSLGSSRCLSSASTAKKLPTLLPAILNNMWRDPWLASQCRKQDHRVITSDALMNFNLDGSKISSHKGIRRKPRRNFKNLNQNDLSMVQNSETIKREKQ
jgi:hypothetical protein